MEQITKYKAKDGREFGTAEAAQRHEHLIDLITHANNALTSLKEDPGCNFANGHGYIQHSWELVRIFETRTLAAILLESGEEMAKRWSENPKGIVGRYLDDSDCVTKQLYYRRGCIDFQWREWGQMFYALNPDKGERIQLAPK